MVNLLTEDEAITTHQLISAAVATVGMNRNSNQPFFKRIVV